MTSKIRVLNEHTINQIAAGEVIENPASVVKELVENSLDAGANDICIEIKTGGRQLIRITDNGCGMNKDDALLCLERHATSKIRDVEDIHAIDTMGFRGEAVPSIASISKFSLLTCLTEANEGTMVVVDGGKISQCCPVARSPGTTIEVKSLFFNVPVRKKFQKSPQHDINEVLKMVSSIALGYPEIKFQLISDQKTILTTTQPNADASFKENLNQRIQDILGMDFANSSTYIEVEKGNYRLEGFVGTPSYTRHNRTGQFLFINKRAVFSPLVSFAVREGFGTSLMTNRHPVFVLHLKIPGKMVDVNVHPQKKEVRLRNEAELKDVISAAVRNGLNQNKLELPPTFFTSTEPITFSQSLEPVFKNSWTPPEVSFPTSFIEKETPIIAEIPPAIKLQEEKPAFQLPLPSHFLKVLTTLKNYIVVEKEGFCLVDQKAAHSRVIFEELTKQKKQITLQQLLIPYTFELTPIETATLLENIDGLNHLGLHICQAGPNSFLLDALPQGFGETDLQILIDEITAAMNEGQDSASKKLEKTIAAAAAKASISHRHRLNLEEAQKLIDRLMKCEFPFQCPLGKPTMIQLGFDEIAKRFHKH